MISQLVWYLKPACWATRCGIWHLHVIALVYAFLRQSGYPFLPYCRVWNNPYNRSQARCILGDEVADCPVCGESLVKGSKSKYCCENESCPVIFVRCSSEPAKRRVSYTSFARKEIMKRIQKVTVKKPSYLFWTLGDALLCARALWGFLLVG